MARDETQAIKSGPQSAPTSRRETIGAVDHAIAVLRCLSEAGEALGVNDIARRIGIHKSTVSRLAATLEKARLVQRDAATGRLALGMGLVALAGPLLAGLGVRDLVRPLLLKLAETTGETVSFCIWDGTDAVSIEQVAGSNSVRAFSTPGHRDPGHATASGKALLAHLGEKAVADYCSRPLRRFTERTIVDPSVLAAELALVRRQGHAINTGELESDIGAVSAVAFDGRSEIAGVVTVTVPMYRFEAERQIELAAGVTRCAAELSAMLGYSTPTTSRG
jgi:DNA-binding IclR family transcriptional regulator